MGLLIGAAVPDLSVFTAINPAFGVGDQQEQVEAVMAGHRRRQRLAALEDDLELVFRRFGAVDTEEKRATADAFAEMGVLAVLGGRDFTYGAVRLAEQHRLPVLDVNAVPTSIFRRAHPYLFTIRAAQDVLYQGFAEWAHEEGLVDGRVIGIFSDRFTRESSGVARRTLEELGHPVAVVVDSDGAGVGSDHDVTAAERFRDAGVDVVIPFVSGSSLIELLRACADLGYRPTIVDLETGEHTTDITAGLVPPELYDGTRAFTMNRVGQLAAGLGMGAEAEEALADFEAHTGRSLDPADRDQSGEVSNLLLVSDLVRLLLAGLEAGGPRTPDGLVKGLEAVRDLRLASGGDASFTSGGHWAIRSARTVEWSASAGCWLARSDFRPLPEGPEISGRPAAS